MNNFTSHISDNHFHVIAPPGSGKTILGIEIVKRLGKKTLVLTPTITIRNQWKDRLQFFFTNGKPYKKYSFSLKSISDITFITYQSLHSFYKTFEDKEMYFDYFHKQGIEVLVLDEAHHLKNAWWQPLYDLKISKELTIVALTATPPYDSDATEITKYFKLCGEIDDEIATPDLVKEGDLCPHQDFVYLSKPEDQEINLIVEFRRKIFDFIENLKKDLQFIAFIKKHRFYSNPTQSLDELYANSEFFSALLIFLNACKEIIPYEKLKILGFDKNDKIQFPPFTNDWVQILFQNLLVSDRLNLINDEEYLSTLEKKLRKLHVFSKNNINLIGNESIYKSLSHSPSKLKSITSILNSEYQNLKENLRAVILTDYIRKEFLNISNKNIKNINKLGVIPIFHHLRVSIATKSSIAVLSGSIVIIHASKIAQFNLIENSKEYTTSPLGSDSEFVTITSKKSTNNNLVAIITKLFELGEIKILIGTKSLLGEGWDAPSINSLILASFIGSFVSSNQMRGRAIRKHKTNSNKTGIIWHLACLDPTLENGGRDVEILQRRFDSFLGISNTDNPSIESGLDRLIFQTQIKIEEIKSINKATLENSKNRNSIIERWEKAILTGSKITKTVNYFHQGKKKYTNQKKIYYKDMVKYIFIELFIALSFFFPGFVLKNIDILVGKGILNFVYALLSALVFGFGLRTYKAIKLYIQHGMIHKKIEKMAYSILDGLYELEHITTNKNNINIITELEQEGNITCTIKGTNRLESTIFINTLDELLQPIKNPRYLIVRTSWLRKKFNIENYFPVPTIFGDKKENCMLFQKHWNHHLGKSNIFYTRHFEGRRLLLKARLFHMHKAFNKSTQKKVIWK